MDMSHLKTQVLTMMMMKSSTTPTTPGAPAKSPMSDVFSILYGMMVMSFIEWLFCVLPSASQQVFNLVKERFGKPKREIWNPLADKKDAKEDLNSITMTRTYIGKAGEKSPSPQHNADNLYVEKVDAVIDYICALDNTKHVKMDTRYSLNTTDEIDLTPLIKARVKQTAGSSEEGGMVLELVIFSSKLKISELRSWVDEVHSNYVFEKNNKLGNKIFYFNEVPVDPVIQHEMMPEGPPRKSYRWDNMPKMLTFSMNEFKTSKSFMNVYGHHVDELKERLDLFVNHPEWYMERGIPHSLGILLHGIPGAGKTSTIKAIAKDTNRHIFNLSLRPYTTQKQLTNLFFNETVVVNGYDGGKQSYRIPLNRRVFVIEDIDCLTDVVMDRQRAKTDAAAPAEKTNANDGDAVTLSFLLNLLDGVLETPGRILVITSNYPEKLDRAFVRPGRIDVRIEFRKATREFILDMLNKFYTVSLKLEDVPAELDGKFTPAEVMECMCRSFKSWSGAVANLVAKVEEARAAQEGTLLEDLGISKEVVVPPSSPKLIISDIESSRSTEKQNIPETQVDSAKKEMEVQIDANATVAEINKLIQSTDFSNLSVADRDDLLVKRIPIKQYNAKDILKKSVMFDDTSEFLGATADFGNDEAPVGAGGWFPGMPREEGETKKMHTSNGPN